MSNAVARVTSDLVEVLSHSGLMPIETRRHDADLPTAPARPYVAWITPARGSSQRVVLESVSNREEAKHLATLAGRQLFPGQSFTASAWPK
jgi:hypothetical protein